MHLSWLHDARCGIAITLAVCVGGCQDEKDELPSPERLTAKIERTTGGGCGFNSVDCPKCNELIILDGMALRTMYIICKKCHCVFNLEK